MTCHFLLLIISVGTVGFVSGYTLNHSMTLTADMLTGYDRRHRPIQNQSTPIQVNVSFDITTLRDVNEVDETFSVAALMYIRWVDEIITWDPASYGGITTQRFQLTDVWFPILVLANPYEDAVKVGEKWMTVRYFSSGNAFFTAGAIFTATCSVDVAYYPFDTQICYLTFAPWGYSSNEIALLSTRNDVLQTFFSENGEWTIVKTYASVDSNFFKLEFTLKRRPLFLTVNVLMPIIFMGCINLFTFMLPEESGERISFSVTCLLAIAVFLTLVSDNLPKKSQPMSVMCYYLMIILSISVLICLAALFNLKIYFTDASLPVPSRCEKFVRIMAFKSKRIEKKSPSNRVCVSPNEDILNDRVRVSNGEHSEFEGNLEDRDNALEDRDNATVSWKEISYSVNRLCLIVFAIITLVVTVVFLSILSCHG